jgi:hypothetical protein
MISPLVRRAVRVAAGSVPEGDAPAPVQRLARELGLGVLIRREAAAGTGYFRYARGVIAYGQPEARVKSVHLKGPDRFAGELPLEVARLALGLKLGAVKGRTTSTGAELLSFRRGTIAWDTIRDRVTSASVEGVTLDRAALRRALASAREAPM